MKTFHFGKVNYSVTVCNDVRGRYKVERKDYRGKQVAFTNESFIYDYCDEFEDEGSTKEYHEKFKLAKKLAIRLFKKKEV